MIISHRHKFIFLKTTKTAGTSVEMALSEQCGANDVLTPIAPDDEIIRAQQGIAARNCNVRFIKWGLKDWYRLIVRRRRMRWYNHIPAAEVHSHVSSSVWNSYFKFTIERNPYDKAVSRYFWSTNGQSVRPDIVDFLETTPANKLSNWHIYTMNDQIAVDYVIRYESLQSDLIHCCRQVGLPLLELPTSKAGFRDRSRHYSQILGESGREIVARVCRKEIEHFGYHFEAAPGL